MPLWIQIAISLISLVFFVLLLRIIKNIYEIKQDLFAAHTASKAQPLGGGELSDHLSSRLREIKLSLRWFRIAGTIFFINSFTPWILIEPNGMAIVLFICLPVLAIIATLLGRAQKKKFDDAPIYTGA